MRTPDHAPSTSPNARALLPDFEVMEHMCYGLEQPAILLRPRYYMGYCVQNTIQHRLAAVVGARRLAPPVSQQRPPHHRPAPHRHLDRHQVGGL